MEFLQGLSSFSDILSETGNLWIALQASLISGVLNSLPLNWPGDTFAVMQHVLDLLIIR